MITCAKTATLSNCTHSVGYDVIISADPVSAQTIPFYDGDVYVSLSETHSQHSISVYTDSGWTNWDPRRPTPVSFMGVVAYPAPCNSQGLKYVASEEEFRQVSEGALADTSTLAYLIARDSGLGGPDSSTPRPRKRGRAGTAQTKGLILSVSRKTIERLDKGKAKETDAVTEDLETYTGSQEMDIYVGHHREEKGGYRRLLTASQLPPPTTAGWLSWNAHHVVSLVPRTCRKDAEVTAFMSRSLKASEINHHYPMLIDLTLHGQPLKVLHHKIRQTLARGTAVLLHGWEPERAMEFNMKDIAEIRPLLSQTIKWQDANIRARTFERSPSSRSYGDYIVEGTLQDFVRASTDANSCSNCLDLPTLVPEVPHFLRGILDDRSALIITGTEAYVSTKGESTKGDCSGLNGPQLMHFDTWRSCAWDIITHGGFLTYPHHDATGFLTYSYVRAGAKLWGYIHLDNVDEFDSQDVSARWRNYYKHPMATETYDKNVIVGTVLLEKGAVLIQPPGANHMVYTPVHTVMSGGHFLTYETLHLTEMALTFDFGLDHKGEHQHATNSLHPGTLRKVYRMAIALPVLVLERPQFPKRSIIALASIVSTNPRSFSIDDYKEDVCLKAKDALARELGGERARALMIMNKVMKKWHINDPWKEMRKGLWNDPGSLEDLTFLVGV
ncbi:hypothetical protein EDD15DRAFT_2380326 [Pisolithus albus]|nr:hypothetical protein EDD15DRAFT_2380326 [Pisolithus albus]